MPKIRPISDLRNNSNEISEYCKKTGEPVFITKNGVGDMVVISMELYEELIRVNESGARRKKQQRTVSEDIKQTEEIVQEVYTADEPAQDSLPEETVTVQEDVPPETVGAKPARAPVPFKTGAKKAAEPTAPWSKRKKP